MGFRLYIDQNTTIGPYPGETLSKDFFGFEGPTDSEVFFDQAILFTNHTPLEVIWEWWRPRPSSWGNPNIGATNRKLAAYENDQFQFSKQTSKNKRFVWSEYLMQSSTWIFTDIL